MEDTNQLSRKYAEIKDELGFASGTARSAKFQISAFYCHNFLWLLHFNKYRVDLKIAASPPIFFVANLVPIQGGTILHDHEQVDLDEAPKP